MSRTGLASLSLLLALAEAHADTCTPSRAMILLDKSSSMVTGRINNVLKWNIAVDALDDVVTAYQSRIELGLMLFPHAGMCTAGLVDVAPGLGNRDEIMAALGTPPPERGNWTPMAQTLDVAGQAAALRETTRSRYVILLTDGWQWCDPYDPMTRLSPVSAVQRLKVAGIATYVVGFGDSVDPVALNQMAVQAGTALAGCNVAGDTPTAPNPCYYRADNAAQLVAALGDIAVQVAAETCDGLDNDCDGTVDNGCECDDGMTRECGTEEGACRAGTQTCTDGTWGMCMGAVGAINETCNGRDDDCDGMIDDEQGGPLCPGGQHCQNGGCSGGEAEEDPMEDGNSAGCGCRVGQGRETRGLPPFLGALGLALAGLLRRRRPGR